MTPIPMWGWTTPRYRDIDYRSKEEEGDKIGWKALDRNATI